MSTHAEVMALSPQTQTSQCKTVHNQLNMFVAMLLMSKYTQKGNGFKTSNACC